MSDEGWDEHIQGAYLLLRDRLVWTETEHAPDTWHVQVTIAGLPVFGNDGHLLGPRAECRRAAFLSLLACVADPDLNPDAAL